MLPLPILTPQWSHVNFIWGAGELLPRGRRWSRTRRRGRGCPASAGVPPRFAEKARNAPALLPPEGCFVSG